MSVTFSAPTLETERLILRPPAIQDVDAWVQFFGSDRSKFVGGPVRPDQAWRILALEVGHWVLRGFGRWALTEKGGDGPAIGIVGLWFPDGFAEHELGWDLFDGATGKGHATEAARAARDYAYGTLGWDTVTSMIDPANTASAAVATRLGAAYDYDYDHPGFGTVQIWRHPGPEGT